MDKREIELVKWLAKRGLSVCRNGRKLIANARVKSWKEYYNQHKGDFAFRMWWDRVTVRKRNYYYVNFQNTRGNGLTLRSPWPFKTYPPKKKK